MFNLFKETKFSELMMRIINNQCDFAHRLRNCPRILRNLEAMKLFAEMASIAYFSKKVVLHELQDLFYKLKALRKMCPNHQYRLSIVVEEFRLVLFSPNFESEKLCMTLNNEILLLIE